MLEQHRTPERTVGADLRQQVEIERHAD